MHVGLAALHLETDDLAAARRELLRSRELGEHAGLPQDAYRWRVVDGPGLRGRGRRRRPPSTLLDEAERLYVGDFSPTSARLPRSARGRGPGTGTSTSARLGRSRRACRATDQPGYLREFEHVTLARVLVAEHADGGRGGTSTRRSTFLDRLLRAADGRAADGGSVIEILVIAGARATSSAATTDAAWRRSMQRWSWRSPRATCARSSTRARPWRRCCGRRAAGASAYVARLRAALAGPGAPDRGARRRRRRRALVEPLSSREREVLRLLAPSSTARRSPASSWSR